MRNQRIGGLPSRTQRLLRGPTSMGGQAARGRMNRWVQALFGSGSRSLFFLGLNGRGLNGQGGGTIRLSPLLACGTPLSLLQSRKDT